jgi:DNA-binding SARP family transcriptional activator/tetratricopeptide (TPR) repeat protein
LAAGGSIVAAWQLPNGLFMSGLDLNFLGDFQVVRDGRALELPPSRKTRALLAWLCLHKRRFRRERLCELLWEVPDDPRGSLRWSLSKLRRLLDEPDRPRVIADRAGVEVDAADVTIDVSELYALAERPHEAPSDALEAAAARYRGNFLEELEFSNFHQFHAWCVAEREQVSRAQAALLRELVARFRDTPERALPYARALVTIAPYDEESRADLIRLLQASHHVDEADQQYQLGVRILKEAGIAPTGTLLAARRRLIAQAPRPAPASEARPATVEPIPTDPDELVGRNDELEQLGEAMTGVVRSGCAEIVLLCGEPGIGKSALLEHTVRLARNHDAVVLQASAYESEAMRPFALWIDSLRASGSDAVERIFDGADAANRDRLFSGLSDVVANETAARPLVLVFDDVQWCDESSAAALHYVTRTNRKRPLLGVIAARESELQDNVALQQVLRGLRRERLLRELPLRPLPDADIARLIERHSPGVDSGRLSRECGGNPLMAIELARAEKEGAAGGSLEQLIRERLARFDVDGAEVLRWAAVSGPRIDLRMLARMTAIDPGRVAAILAGAEEQAILMSTDHGLRFSHELVARAVYAGISPVRRQVMHRRIAEQMEQDATLDLAFAADLAYHATHSGDPALAARGMVSAGRLCLRFFANDEALSLARKGLQLTRALPAAERVCLEIDLNDIMLSAAPLDDWEEAARRYAELAEQALDHGARAHATLGYHMAAYVRWTHDHWTGAREQILQSERAARGGREEDHLIGMAQTAKCLAMLERDLSHADAMLMEAQSVAARKRLRHPAIPGGFGILRFHENRLDEAEELLKEARTLCKCAGDRVNEYQANEYLVMIDIQRGLYADARVRCGELLAIGEKLRAGSEAPFARALQGLCGYALDDLPQALDTALDDLRIADAKHRLAYVLTRAALIDFERGRFDKAIARAAEALGYAELLERATEKMLAHVVLGLAREASGEGAEARRHLAEAAELEAAGVAEWARGLPARLTATEQGGG